MSSATLPTTLTYIAHDRMLYSCTHMATVGVKGSHWKTFAEEVIIVRAELAASS